MYLRARECGKVMLEWLTDRPKRLGLRRSMRGEGATSLRQADVVVDRAVQ